MTIGAVPPPQPPGPDDLPLALLVDYDGTIALTDVSDALMAEFVTEEWEAKAADYDAGRIGSRRLMEWEIGLITSDPASLVRLAAEQPHDPGFASLVRTARSVGAVVEVVSDGFGFFIPAALDRLGAGGVAVVSAATTFEAGRPAIAFPNGHPACFVCGTCKRARVGAHQAAGRAVVFVGDGESDRYAAGYADIVFAKRALIPLCRENGWPYRAWTRLAEVEAWLTGVIAGWRANPDDPSLPRPAPRPFFCGPEAWGPGRVDPPMA